MSLHRTLSLSATAFLALHIAIAIVDGYVDITVLDAVVPFVSGYEPLWLGLGAVALDLLPAVVITSLLGARIGHRRHTPAMTAAGTPKGSVGNRATSHDAPAGTRRCTAPDPFLTEPP
ncbi:hypothetical protein ACFWWT_32935 [Streptomyces sp. NPDC058676]|uniref:hypothetical protein n=1 Tax=unclassified Streptomyces TaxID=2593676 RepID=UPI003653D9F8